MMRYTDTSNLVKFYFVVTIISFLTSITGLIPVIQFLSGIIVIFAILPHLSLVIGFPEFFEEGGLTSESGIGRRILIISFTLPVVILSSVGLLLGIIGRADQTSFSTVISGIILVALIFKSNYIRSPLEIGDPIRNFLHSPMKSLANINFNFTDYAIFTIASLLLLATISDFGTIEDDGTAILYIVGDDGSFYSLEENYTTEEKIVIFAKISNSHLLEYEENKIVASLNLFEDENGSQIVNSEEIGIFEISSESNSELSYRFEFQVAENGFYSFSAVIIDSELEEIQMEVTHKFKVSD